MRYTFFKQKSEAEGFNQISALFGSTATSKLHQFFGNANFQFLTKACLSTQAKSVML